MTAGVTETLARLHARLLVRMPKSQRTIVGGAKWRKCAAAAIIDSSGRILIGERIKIAGAWNCPQGGMDAVPVPETVAAAAAREAYEEMGLRAADANGESAHMVLAAAQESDEEAVRYEAGGWLANAGFAGQQCARARARACEARTQTSLDRLHWALFFVADARLDANPSRVNGSMD